MKNATPVFNRLNLRAFVASLITYLMLAGQLAPLAMASAGRAAPPAAKPALVSETRTNADRGAGEYAAQPVPAPLAAPAFVPNITATKVDAYPSSPGPAVPGETITYTVQINNTGTMDATGVMFNDTVDPNTTLVPGSLTVTPVARDDAFTATGNITSSRTAPGVLANDSDPDGGTLTVTQVQGSGANVGVATATNTAGRGGVTGFVTLNADGSFTYEPPPGFTGGNDTFSYTASDGSLTNNATVTITLSQIVWFINNNAGGSQNRGTFADPFTTIATFNTANAAGGSFDPKDNDFISLRTGTGTYAGADGINLRAGQRLIGEGTRFDTLFTADASSSSAYQTFASTVGTPPTITTTAGNGIDLNSGNTVRGLNVGNVAGGAKIFGNNFGMLTVGNTTTPDVALSGTGQALNLTTGTFVATSAFNGVATTSSGTQGINLAGIAGTVAFGSTTVSGSATQGILVGTTTANINFGNTSVTGGTDGVSFQNNSGGTPTFGTLTVSGGSGTAFLHGAGGGNVTVNNLATLTTGASNTIDIQNSTAMTTVNFAGGATLAKTAGGGAGVNLNTANGNVTFGGTLTIGTSVARFPSPAVMMTGGTGAYSLGAVSIFTNNQAGITATNADGTINSTSGTVDVGAATALNIDGPAGITTLGMTLTTVNSTGGTNNVRLLEVGGSLNIQGGALSGATAAAFTVNGSTATITCAASVTNTTNGISLTSNTGGIISFTGGLNLNTGANAAFTATGGGTVNVTGTNTITTTTGAAVNITDTTIGASNVTFQSINKNGNNTAIILDDTGAGTFNVTGTGTTGGSGGTIENITASDAITLNNTDGLVTFRNMIIEDIGSTAGAFNTISGHDAIHGQQVDGGLTLNNTIIRRISDNAINGSTFAGGAATVWNGLTITGGSLIENTNRFHVASVGDANNEGMVRILGLTGTVNITDSTFQDGAEMLDLFPTSGTMTMTVTNNNFHRAYKEFTSGTTASVGGHCVDVTVQNAANAVVNIGHRTNNALDNDFLNCRLGSVRVANDAGATGNVDVLIGQNEFTVNDHSSGFGGDFDFPQGGVLIQARGTNTATFDVVLDSNYFDEIANASGGVGQFSLDMDGGQWNVIAEENTFDTPGNAPWFIRADNQGNTGTMNSNILFQNNNYIQGFFTCPDPSCGGGYTAPGLRSLVDTQFGANINFTLSSDELVEHDAGFDPGQTVEVRKLNQPAGGNNGTVCANFVNNDAPDGYSVENFTTGGAFNIQQGASNSGPCANCTDAQIADVFADNGNTGGANNPATFPPFVNVFNTPDGGGPINIVAAPCTQPSIPFAPETVTEQKFETPAPAEALSADATAPLTEPLDDLMRLVLPPIDDESSDEVMSWKIARRAARRSTSDEQKGIAPISKLPHSAPGDIGSPGAPGDMPNGSPAPRPDGAAPVENAQPDAPPSVSANGAGASRPSLPALADQLAELMLANRTERASGNPLGLRPTAKRDSGAAFSHTASASAAPLGLAPSYAAQDKQRKGGGGGPSGAPPQPAPRIKPTPNGVGGGSVMVTIGTLGPSDSVTITFQVTINTPYMGGAQVSNQGTVSGSNFSNVLTDDPAAGGAADPTVTPVLANPNMTIQDAKVAEPTSGMTPMVFTVSLSAPALSTVTVDYATANGGANPATGGANCATAGTDYLTTNGMVSFSSGQQVKTISVEVCADTDNSETDETFLVNLSNPSGATITDGQATGTITVANPAGATLISELRHFGPGAGNDPNDEFVEIYNNTDSPLTVAASDASAGYGLYKMGADCAATPVLIGTIPNGTVIPARGHYLFTGTAYSLANYGGTGAAAGNSTLTAEIEANRNVALFSTTDIVNISTANRLDAVGFGANTGGVCDLLREGTTQPAVTMNQTMLGQHSYFRKLCDFVSGVGCSTPGQPKDTNVNSVDFQFADTEGTNAGAGQRLGAPGPENLASPRRVPDANFPVGLLDNTKAPSAVPNRMRDLSMTDPVTSSFGTLSIRRRVVNNTGGTVTRLRFRIVELTTFPTPPGTADLRAITSMQIMVGPVGDAGTCGAMPTPCTVTVQGTTLETPPAQPNGGGLNATFSATLPGGGLPNGQSLNLQFLLGVQQTGTFRFLLIVEALP